MFVLESINDHFPKTIELADALDRNETRPIAISKYDKHLVKLEHSKSKCLVIACRNIDSKLLETIDSLTSVDVIWIHSARSIEAEFKHPRVKTIVITDCSFVSDLGFLKSCSKLKHLKLDGCKHLVSLEGLGPLEHLEEFEVQGRPTSVGTLATLEPIAACKSLRYLSLASRVKNKSSLTHLSSLKKLEYLWLCNLFPKSTYEAILDSCDKLEAVQLHNGVYTHEDGFQSDDDD